jgi:hypothetical protein
MHGRWMAAALLLLATSAHGHEGPPATMQGALGDSLALVGIRRSPQMRAFAAHVTTLANLALSTSPTAATAIGRAGIDATLETLGPVYLTNPHTMGAGQWNVNVLGGTTELDNLDGASLDPTPEPGLLVLEDRGDTPVAVALEYHLSLRQSAVGLAATYGLTDHVNVSLLLPFVASSLTIRAHAGDLAGAVRVRRFGVGDLTARVKVQLPDLWGVYSAVSLDAQFPTGKPEDLAGTGDYWLTPMLAARKVLGDGRADVTANVGIDVDVSATRQTQALYGIGTSVVLWSPWLVGAVEFLGRSQLASVRTATDTDVVYLTPTGLETSPLFGFTFDRADYLELAFGVRIQLPPVAIILGGVYHLDDAGLHDTSIAPTAGIGATW